jgi:hypothetical protein
LVPSYSPSDLCLTSTVLVPAGLPTTGTYTLYIVPGGWQKGTFNLQVLSQSVTASLTVGGAAVPITIPSTAPGRQVAVSIPEFAGDAITVSNTGSTLNCTGDTVSLVGPDGQIVVPSYSPSDLCLTSTVLPPTGLTEDGTYTLYIVPGGWQKGTFNLQALSYPA